MANYFNDAIGIDPNVLVEQIVTKGVPKYDAIKLINDLVAVNLGQLPRRFSYSVSLPNHDDSCLPAFSRSFEHTDWIDGESVVQAGESPGDRGFNWRFTALGTDLDSLAADVVRLYACLEQLRGSLVTALQDVAAELNRLNNDVADLHTKTPAPKVFPYAVENAPKFLGIREFDGSKVTMWQQGANVVMLPGIHTADLSFTVTQRLQTGGLVARALSVDEDLARVLKGGAIVSEVIAKFGDAQLGDGRTLGQGLAILAPESRVDEKTIVDLVNTQEQAFLRSTVGSIDAVSAVLGTTSTGAPLVSVNPGLLAGAIRDAPPALGSALDAAGLSTIDKLVAVPHRTLITQLKEQGVTITPAQARELSARASMIAGLGIPGR